MSKQKRLIIVFVKRVTKTTSQRSECIERHVTTMFSEGAAVESNLSHFLKFNTQRYRRGHNGADSKETRFRHYSIHIKP